ncbi:hypothetical protein FCULG_00008919, partial [Fusarium culmorum]
RNDLGVSYTDEPNKQFEIIRYKGPSSRVRRSMRLARRAILWPSMSAYSEITEVMSSSRLLINATIRSTGGRATRVLNLLLDKASSSPFNANVYCSPIYFVFEGIPTRQDRTQEIRNLQTVESMPEGSFVSERRNGDTWNVKHLVLRKL